MPKQKIETQSAPAAIGPYSQAIKVKDFVFLSGQIPLAPEHTTLISEDFREQAIQVIKNLQTVCIAAGGHLDKIVKLTIYLTDLAHFSIVNEVMLQFFTEPYPARATLQVAALPKSAQIEIEAIMAMT